MGFEEFIKPELIVLIPVLYLIGIALKRSKLPDHWIPMLLGAIAILLSALWVMATSHISNGRDIADAAFVSITQGILTAGAGVYIHQLYIQSKKKNKK